MQFRRSGQREVRRRRVIIDETTTPKKRRTRQLEGDSTDETTAKSYSQHAWVENQPPITCLLPKKAWWLSLLLLIAMSSVAGLEYLYYQVEVWKETLGLENLVLLDVTQPGSLASWVSSMLLMVACVASLCVYSIRRYKIDDYRGRYRIWLWATAALSLACVTAGVPLHRLISSLLTHMTATTLFGNEAAWWITTYAIVFGSLYLRMLIEVRHSRAALVSLITAGIGYLVSAGITLQLFTFSNLQLTALVQSSSTLLAHLSLSYSVLLYARYVFLDAQGLLPVRKVKEKTEEIEDSLPDTQAEPSVAEISEKPVAKKRLVRVDTSHAEPTQTKPLPPAKPATKKKTSRQLTELEEEIERLESKPDYQLSKAERRRLRKLKHRQGQ